MASQTIRSLSDAKQRQERSRQQENGRIFGAEAHAGLAAAFAFEDTPRDLAAAVYGRFQPGVDPDLEAAPIVADDVADSLGHAA